MRLVDIDPIIERLKNAIYIGKRIGEDTANMEAVLADVEAAPTYNDDLISRQAALDAVINGVCLGCDCDVIDKLKALPSAEPRKGKWISETKGKVAILDEFGNVSCSARCSECGDWLTASDEYSCRGNYCPNCGADMREESE